MGGSVQAGGGEASGGGVEGGRLERGRSDCASLGGTCGGDGERQQSAEELQGWGRRRAGVHCCVRAGRIGEDRRQKWGVAGGGAPRSTSLR